VLSAASKHELWVSLKIGATIYAGLLVIGLIGGLLPFMIVGPTAHLLMLPGLLAARALLGLVTNASPASAAGAMVLIAASFDICLFSLGVLLLRRAGLWRDAGTTSGAITSRRPVAPASPVARRVRRALVIGFAMAVLGMALALVLYSLRVRLEPIFPLLAPGVWACGRLFGQPSWGPQEIWILLAVVLNTLAYSVVVLLAEVLLAMWRRRV
jgi:hypothetical protein